jgi:hypothetical protein
MPFLDVFFLDFCPQCFFSFVMGACQLFAKRKAGRQKKKGQLCKALLCFAKLCIALLCFALLTFGVCLPPLFFAKVLAECKAKFCIQKCSLYVLSLKKSLC